MARIVGGDRTDYLDGTGSGDVILGGGGDDEVSGGGGDDRIEGGAGDDYIEGGPGRDEAAGGAGHDTIDLDVFDAAVDAADGGEGDDQLYGGFGDRLAGGGGDDLLGGSGFVASGGPGRDVFGPTINLDYHDGANWLDAGSSVVEDFQDGTDALEFSLWRPHEDGGIVSTDGAGSFAVLDTSGDGRIDGADEGVTVAGDRLSIDFLANEALAKLPGYEWDEGPQGVTVVGVQELTAADLWQA
jgi:RTX calcium-binding nonapeptide repeat (4 copies)